MKTDTSTLEIRVKRDDGTPLLVTFGAGGHTVHYAEEKHTYGTTKSHQSGYDSPENFFEPSKWWAHTWMEQRDKSQFEGVPFIDKRAAVETKEGRNMVLSGPMVDVDLKDGEVDELPALSAFVAPALAQGFGYIVPAHQAARALKERSPLGESFRRGVLC